MPAGNPQGYLSRAWSGDYGMYGGAITAGGASAVMDYTTDINPLTAITPSPWEAALYGFAATNPWQAMKRLGKALLPGQRTMEYQGAIGYKTLMTGVRPGSLWSNLSLGNVVLSGVQAGARGLGRAFDIADDPTIAAFSQARTKGLAGLFGTVEDVKGTGKNWQQVLSKQEISDVRNKIRNRWSGRRHVSGYTDAMKQSLKAAARNKTVGAKAVGAGTQLMYWLGGTNAAGGKAMVQIGGKGLAGVGGRLAAGLSGIGTAWLLYDVTTAFTGSPFQAAQEGITDLATGLLQWQRDVAMPEFGTGQIPMAMQNAGAATERRRAIQASYSAKINPGNRMLGNEARYHHSR